mmetsp:Transcript_24431/g.34155  ORF Transcript_24431/g.34155 Transcript_24431/m.34155 type:complete len:551 (+) Transcript_24431:290-1942(+)
MLLICEIKIPDANTTDERTLLRSASGAKSPSVKIHSKIAHPGEITNIKVWAQKDDILATQSHCPEVYLWNVSMISEKRSRKAAVSVPHLILKGHEQQERPAPMPPPGAIEKAFPSKSSTFTSRMRRITEAHESGGSGSVSVSGSINRNADTARYSQQAAFRDIKKEAKEKEPQYDQCYQESEYSYYYAMDFASESPCIISGGSDMCICLWTLNDASTSLGLSSPAETHTTSGRKRQKLSPGCHPAELQWRQRFLGHSGTVKDMRFDPQNCSVFASVAEDKMMLLWDRRQGSNPVHRVKGLHRECISALDWNQHCPNYLLTGSQDGVIKLLDLRAIGSERSSLFGSAKEPIPSMQSGNAQESIEAGREDEKRVDAPVASTFSSSSTRGSGIVTSLFGHTSGILNLEWNPKCPHIFASSSAHGQLCIWDVSHHIGGNSPKPEMCVGGTKRGNLEISEGRSNLHFDTSAHNLRCNLEDGFPPELIFRHLGHSGIVTNFCWNRNDPWSVASLSDNRLPSGNSNGMLQIWRMCSILTSSATEAHDHTLKGLSSIR